jgi:hypothetical protein
MSTKIFGPGETVGREIDVSHLNVSFRRGNMTEVNLCTFCKRSTFRVLAHKTAKDKTWGVVPCCDGCMNALKKVEVSGGELIIDVGGMSVSFARGPISPNKCLFCKKMTLCAIGHRRPMVLNWEAIACCNGCLAGLKKVPVQDGEKIISGKKDRVIQ